MAQLITYQQVMRNRNFSILWLTEGISLIGDRLAMVALIVYIYSLTRSGTSLGIFMMSSLLPIVLFGAMAGVFVDRWDKKAIMIACNIIRGILVLLILIATSLYQIYLIWIIVACFSALFYPTRNAVLPYLVKREELLIANSLFVSAFQLAGLIGPAIGGLIVASLGPKISLFLDSLSFFVPAIAVAFLPIPRTSSKKKRSKGLVHLWRELMEGFNFLKRDTTVTAAIFLNSSVFLIIGAPSLLAVIVAKEILAKGTVGYGFLMSAIGVGMLLGNFGVGKFGQQTKRKVLVINGFLILGLTLLLGSLLISGLIIETSRDLVFGLSLIAFAIVGMGAALIQVPLRTTIQEAPEVVRGRVFGVYSTIFNAAVFISQGSAGFLADLLGVKLVILTSGFLGLTLWWVSKDLESLSKL